MILPAFDIDVYVVGKYHLFILPVNDICIVKNKIGILSYINLNLNFIPAQFNLKKERSSDTVLVMIMRNVPQMICENFS